MASPEPAPVRIGLIGAGAIMRLSHAPMIRQSKVARLVGVFDRDRARAEQLDSDFAIGFSAALAERVTVKRPAAACERAGVVLQVGFNQRYWNQVRIARQLIAEGFIGRIHAVRSVYSERWNVYPATTRYRYDLAQSGGATIIDLTIHRIDLLRHLIGDFAAIFAELAHSEVPDPVDDNVWLLARFAGGARGCLSSDRYSPAIGDGTDIWGSEGAIHLATETINPFHAVPLAVYTEKKSSDLPAILREAHYPDAWWKGFSGGWITLKPPRQSPYEAQLAAFCDSVRNGTPPAISGLDGLKAQEVIQAAYLSMRRGGWVDLPLPADAPFIVPDYQRG